MAGLYIHIPYCRRKCIYCDFYSLGARNAPWGEYVDALLVELRERRGEIAGEPLTTIYIGGGTPSLMPAGEFERLVSGVRGMLDTRAVEEFTVEVNPDDVTGELVEMYAGCGVNRVSMGVQSFDDAELKAIGRRHTAEQARRACGLLRRLGNVSIDLIFGLPGQTLESWRRTVAEALALRAEHVSAYSLMWEEGTALSLLRKQGRMAELPEGVSVDMYDELRRAIAAAGYRHYEISNYALPGYESRHNSSYWAGTPYLGLGPGAHSYDGERTRRANPGDVRGYLAAYAPGETQAPRLFCEAEVLSDNELREEYVMTRMRTAEGIDCGEYGRRFGGGALASLLRAAEPHLRAGHLTEAAGRLSLSPEAVMLLDAVTVDLL